MDKLKWRLLFEMHGRLQAELLKSFLEANGIDVEIFQEAVGHNIYPVMGGPMSRVQFFVPSKQFDEAKEILADYAHNWETS